MSDKLSIKLPKEYNDNNKFKDTLNEYLVLLLCPLIESNHNNKIIFNKNYLTNNNKDIFYTTNTDIRQYINGASIDIGNNNSRMIERIDNIIYITHTEHFPFAIKNTPNINSIYKTKNYINNTNNNNVNYVDD